MHNIDHIPYGKQTISDDDIQSVIQTLQSDWLTTGPTVTAFEELLAKYCGSSHVVAVCNGTAALHLACLTLDIQPGDYVWTSPNSFLASANCALYCGAQIDFVDICPTTYNLSADLLEEKLEKARKQNKLPKLVIPVHFSGQSCEMKKIKALSDHYGFYIIEDACHSLGGYYQGNPIGNCQYSDMTVFSFHPVKIITTGEGGAISTNNKMLADKMRTLRSHGMIRNENMMREKSHGPWYYEQHDLGLNYRITDIQCALGIAQLKKLNAFAEKRNQLAKNYDDLLKNLPIILPYVSPKNYSAFHLYVIQIDANKTNKSRLDVFNYLLQHNIGVNVHYIPIHTQPYYREKFGFQWGDFSISEQYYRNTLSLPIFPGLTNKEQERIIGLLSYVFSVTI